MEKLILKNLSFLEIEPGSSLSAIKVISSSKADMIEKWDLLTKENLSLVEVRNDEEFLIGEYKDLILIDETSVVMDDGRISTVFRVREKTDVERLQEEVIGLGERSDMIEASVLELSEVIYA